LPGSHGSLPHARARTGSLDRYAHRHLFQVSWLRGIPEHLMQPLLKVESLEKRYAAPRRHEAKEIIALAGVSFSIFPATTLALVGESGSGKGTLALCLACLERASSGSIWFEGRDLAALPKKDLRHVRPQLQVVFQDPASSLNPKWTALDIVSEPLVLRQQFTPVKKTV